MKNTTHSKQRTGVRAILKDAAQGLPANQGS